MTIEEVNRAGAGAQVKLLRHNEHVAFCLGVSDTLGLKGVIVDKNPLCYVADYDWPAKKDEEALVLVEFSFGGGKIKKQIGIEILDLEPI